MGASPGGRVWGCRDTLVLVGFSKAREKQGGQWCGSAALMLLSWEGAWGSSRWTLDVLP